MTDRVPGAPGRCKGTVTAEELQKLQAGKEFAITLRRDDLPIKEGTPYSKASVLPDALAAKLCPEVPDPAPKDAFAALQAQKADTVRRRTGTAVALPDAACTPLKGLKLYGKTTQNGTPTPTAPIALESAGKGGSIGVKVLGKNLTPSLSAPITQDGITFTPQGDGSFVVNGTATKQTYIRFAEIRVESGETYTLSGCMGGSGKTYQLYCVSDCIKLYSPTVSYPLATGVATGSGVTRVYFIVYAGTTVSNLVIKPQLEIGKVATAYEPYKKPQALTVSTPGGLHGISVSGGGNYTDNNGQQWVCDEKDFVSGVRVQRLYKETYNGTEGWRMENGQIYLPREYMGALPKPNTKNLLMSHFVCNSGEVLIYIGNTWGITLNKHPYATVDEWKDWLAQNNLTVLYELKTPVETPLSVEELEAYAKLHSYSPTTVLNDAGADMEVTYYTPTTAVQMVHSPKDKGKILTVDEHGCVVLTPSAYVIASGDTDLHNGYYHWRKWSDGFAEIWVNLDVNVDYYADEDTVGFGLSLPFDICTDESVHITMNAYGYRYESGDIRDRGSATYASWQEVYTEFEGDTVKNELYVYALAEKPGWTHISGTAYMTGYWYNEEEGQL